MIAAIEAALAPLRGLPLLRIGRAAGMVWVQFGTPRRVPTRDNPDRILGEYALHLQCPWRISGTKGILTGTSDLFVPADPTADEETFRWDEPGDALADHHFRAWIAEHAAAPLVVERIAVDRCGGFVLGLSKDYAIEVFPDASAGEHASDLWRVFRTERKDDEGHFVWPGQGDDVE